MPLTEALTIENYETVLTHAIGLLEGNPAQASVQEVLKQLEGYQEFYNGLRAYTGGEADAYNGMAGNNMAENAALFAEGTAQLAAGTQGLLAGTGTLVAGTGDLAEGAGELQDGIGTLKDGSNALIDGVSQLNDGAIQLSDGMKKFDEEGIQKIVDAYNGDIKGLIERIKACIEASKKYQSFSGKAKDVEGRVQFIFRTEGIEED